MIDGRLTSPWPEAVLEASRRWRQGYVVDTPPFFYYRSDSNPVWRVELEAQEDASEGALIELEPSERPPYGLITTQTCDLFEEGRPKQPWFAVAPVHDFVRRLQPGQLTQLQKGHINHLVLLSAAWLPAGHWVADLRIEMPIEKGWLVGREPRQGFAELKEYDHLAEKLASRRGRPALSNPLTMSLSRPLREWLRGRGSASLDSIESLRVRVVGDPVVSTQAELLVIVKDSGLPPHLRAAWNEWERLRIDAAEGEGVLLFPFRYGTLDEFSARDIETSLRLDFDYLSPE